jgi:hypothetical protein
MKISPQLEPMTSGSGRVQPLDPVPAAALPSFYESLKNDDIDIKTAVQAVLIRHAGTLFRGCLSEVYMLSLSASSNRMDWLKIPTAARRQCVAPTAGMFK